MQTHDLDKLTPQQIAVIVEVERANLRKRAARLDPALLKVSTPDGLPDPAGIDPRIWRLWVRRAVPQLAHASIQQINAWWDAQSAKRHVVAQDGLFG